MKKTKLKTNREAEKRKVDLAVKYDKQGKATGGLSTNPKRVRRNLEAPFIPPAPAPRSKARTKKAKSK